MQRPSEFDTGIAPPPRILMIAAVTALYFVLLLGAALITWLLNERRLIAIVPVALIGILVFAALSLLSALIFRRGLPRLFFLWLLIAYIVLGAAGAVGGVAVYRTVLPPRYQQELGTLLPFMRGFLPPTPEGGIIPTAAATSPISAESLLNMPLLAVTAAPSAEPAGESTAEARLDSTLLISALTETPTPLPTDTPPPTAAPTSPPTEAPPPTAEPTEILPTLASAARAIDRPAAARMYGFIHVQQTWNNCGPANVTMALSFYGWRQPQTFAQQWLKPHTEDKNVTPAEIVNFVNTQTQVKAITRIGGDIELLKDFIAANIPVIVETSYQFEGYDWIGHYQTVVGYDDNARIFYVYDSYLGAGENGAGIPEPYDRFDRVWQNFNRAFIAIYEPNREALVAQILGHRADVTAAAEHALLIAQQEARANPSDAFAWFNMGSSLVELGRYEEAAAAYDRATLAGLPFRITWYQFGSFKAYYEVGRYQDVLALVNTNLTNGAQYVEETHYWQGRVFAAQGRLNEAAAAFRRALSHNPRFEAARAALNTISS
jgi:hypothetical protein